MGMVLPSLDTITSSLAGREFRAGVTSFRTSSIRIGQTVGPPLFTAVAVVTGYGVDDDRELTTPVRAGRTAVPSVFERPRLLILLAMTT